MHRLIYKIVFSTLLAVVIIEGTFLSFGVAKSVNLQAEISEFEREQEVLQMQIVALESENQKHAEKIGQLKREEDELALQKDEANRRVYDLARNGYAIKPLQASQKVDLSELRYIRLVAPNGGETLCLGEEYIVRWESSGIAKVQIIFRGNSVGGAILESGYPANLNETGDPFEGTYLWKVGKAGEMDEQDLMAIPGEDYTFSLVSFNGASSASEVVGDRSDASFSIIQCDK